MMTLEQPVTKSLERSYRLHADALYAYLLSQCGDSHTAEDLLQQCFLKRAKATQPVTDEKAYLFIITRNLLINLRKARRTSLTLNENALPLYATTPAATLDTAKLSRALAELSENDREIITLKFFSDLSFREMEQVLGVARSTLHDRYEQALHTLYLSYRTLGGEAP